MKDFKGYIMSYEAITLKDNKGNITVKRIDNIAETEWKSFNQFRPDKTDIYSKQQSTCSAQIMTSEGWKKIEKIVRYRTNKKLYTIATERGVVTITEDNFLITNKNQLIKPYQFKSGIKLMHRNINVKGKTELVGNRMFTDPVDAQEYYLSLKNRAFVHVCYQNGFYSFKEHHSLPIDCVWYVKEIPNCDYDDFVYTIETENDTFNAGVGNMIII